MSDMNEDQLKAFAGHLKGLNEAMVKIKQMYSGKYKIETGGDSWIVELERKAGKMTVKAAAKEGLNGKWDKAELPPELAKAVLAKAK